MNQQEFIDAIKVVIVENCSSGYVEFIKSPPGRKPADEVISQSAWFNDLLPDDKLMVAQIIKGAVHLATFQFLCILDGVASIEDIGEKGRLELRFIKNNKSVLLNDPDENYLHDIFNAID